MNISFNTVRFNSYKNCQNKYFKLRQLPYDCVSFTSMKKTQFSDIDLAAINKFQAPIEKFNSNKDLERWSTNRIREIMTDDYLGRQLDTTISREDILEDWFTYLYKNCSPAATLLILNDITRDLKPDNDNLPPMFNKAVFQNTIKEIREKLKENPKEQINFDKLYRENLKKYFFEEKSGLSADYTGWLVIESQKNNPEQFEENIDKLMALSYKTWCTADIFPEHYLQKGDFHIYFNEGKPKIAVRFEEDEIKEIQGEKNNNKIPAQYLDMVIEHIKNYKLSNTVKRDINISKEAKPIY